MSNHWAQLSSELWCKVFELSKAEHDEGKLSEQDLFKLPSVCKLFAAIFTQHSQLSSYIKVSNKLSNNQMISLGRHIHLHRDTIDRFTDEGSGRNGELLLVMLTNQVALVKIKLKSAELPMEYVAGIKSITYCELSYTGNTDLAPLHELPSLTVLVLERGDFDNLEAAAINLTRLALHTCHAGSDGDCMCVTSLKCLELDSSALINLHTNGVVACHSLQSLSVKWSDIEGRENSENFSTSEESMFVLPASLSNLTNLTALSFYCYGDDELMNMINLSCLTVLRSLQRLTVTFKGGAGLELPECMTALTALSYLALVICPPRERSRNRLLLAFDLDWSALVSLRHLRLMGDLKFTGRFRLSSLALVSTLNFVCIEVYGGKDKVDRNLLMQLCKLAHELGTDRPDVKLILVP